MVMLRRAILACGSTLRRVMSWDDALAVIGSVTEGNRYHGIVVSISNGRTPDACDLNVAFDDDLTAQGASDALIAAGEHLARLHHLRPGKPVVAASPELIEAADITAQKFVDFCRSGSFGTGENFRFDETRQRCVDELTHAILAATVDDDTRMADVGAVGDEPDGDDYADRAEWKHRI